MAKHEKSLLLARLAIGKIRSARTTSACRARSSSRIQPIRCLGPIVLGLRHEQGFSKSQLEGFSVWLACVILLASHASPDLATQQALLQEPW